MVAAGLQETGATTRLTARLLGRPRSVVEAQARLIAPVGVLSAFMNNTPLVATFLPVVHDLSKRTGIAASRLYMPLSFAAAWLLWQKAEAGDSSRLLRSALAAIIVFTLPLAQSMVISGLPGQEPGIFGSGCLVPRGLAVQNVRVTLAKAFEGTTAVYAMIPPDYGASDPIARQQSIGEAISGALREMGVRKCVNLSSVGAQNQSGAGPVSGLSVQELLARYGLAGRRVAVAINTNVVPRSRFAEVRIAEGDRVEVIHAVGGG